MVGTVYSQAVGDFTPSEEQGEFTRRVAMLVLLAITVGQQLRLRHAITSEFLFTNLMFNQCRTEQEELADTTAPSNSCQHGTNRSAFDDGIRYE
jgi:hypothetical protein